MYSGVENMNRELNSNSNFRKFRIGITTCYQLSYVNSQKVKCLDLPKTVLIRYSGAFYSKVTQKGGKGEHGRLKEQLHRRVIFRCIF